jgi:hypothetical protein
MESGEVKETLRADNKQPPKEWKKIFNHPDIEIYWPSKITVLGFLAAWCIVTLIIVGTMFLARIGG